MSFPKHTNFPVLASLFMVILIDTMGFGIIFPVLSPIFMGSNGGILPAGASMAERDIFYGLTLGVFAICMFLGAPILGDISDQVGRKKVILLCLFGTSISALICAVGIQYGSVSLLLIGRMLAGFLAGSQPIAQAAIADVSDAKTKTVNLGLIAFAGSIGFIIGPIMGGFFSDTSIIPWFTYATPFYVDAIFALFNGLLLILSFTETFKPYKAFHFNLMKGVEVFLQAFKHKNVRGLSLIFLFSQIAFSLYFQFVSLYLVTIFNYSSSQLGLFMSYIGLLFGITLSVIIRFVLKFSSEDKIAVISLYISAIGFILPGIFHNEYAQWIAIMPIAIGSGLSYNTLLSIYSDAVSKDQQGWVMGVTSSIVGASWILSSLLTGLLYYFEPILPFYFSMFMAAFSGILLQRWL